MEGDESDELCELLIGGVVESEEASEDDSEDESDDDSEETRDEEIMEEELTQQISSPPSCAGAAGNVIGGHVPNSLEDSLVNDDPLIGIVIHGPVVVYTAKHGPPGLMVLTHAFVGANGPIAQVDPAI